MGSACIYDGLENSSVADRLVIRACNLHSFKLRANILSPVIDYIGAFCLRRPVVARFVRVRVYLIISTLIALLTVLSAP